MIRKCYYSVYMCRRCLLAGAQNRRTLPDGEYRKRPTGSIRRKGFVRVGVDEIATAAGLTKRTLYAHFEEPKDALLAAVLASQRTTGSSRRSRPWAPTSPEARKRSSPRSSTSWRAGRRCRDDGVRLHAAGGRARRPAGPPGARDPRTGRKAAIEGYIGELLAKAEVPLPADRGGRLAARGGRHGADPDPWRPKLRRRRRPGGGVMRAPVEGASGGGSRWTHLMPNRLIRSACLCFGSRCPIGSADFDRSRNGAVRCAGLPRRLVQPGRRAPIPASGPAGPLFALARTRCGQRTSDACVAEGRFRSLPEAWRRGERANSF